MTGKTKFLVLALLFFGTLVAISGFIFSVHSALAVMSQCSEAGVCVGGDGGGTGGGTQSPAICSDGASNCGYTAPISVNVGCTIQLSGGQQYANCQDVDSFPNGTFVSGAYTGRVFSGQGTAIMNPVDDDGHASINGSTFYNSNPPGCSCGVGAESGNNCGGSANGSGVRSVNIPEGASLSITVENKCVARFDGTWGAGSASATSQATYCFSDATNATPSHVGSYVPSADGHCQFVATQRTLTVAKNGTGSGTVSSAPGGISCGATCSATFDHGTNVTLSATPDAGSTFAGWSGDCTTNGGVNMTANKSCTATFNRGFSCTGNIPDANSVLCSGTDQGLTQDTPKTLVFACGTTPKCSYGCGPGYQYTGSLMPGSGYCAPIPQHATGTVAVAAKYSDNSACTASWTITGGMSPLTGTGSGAIYPDQWANQGYVMSVGSPAGATISPSASQYLLPNGEIDYNINCGQNPATAKYSCANNACTVDPAGQYTGLSSCQAACGGGVGGSFTCSITPSTQTIAPGGSTSYNLSLNPLGGWTGNVSVAISGAPAGATYSGPANLSNVNSSGAINVSSQASVAPGAYGVNAVLTQLGGGSNSASCSGSLSVSASCSVCSGVINPLPAHATCSQYSNCKDSVFSSCNNNCVDFVCDAPYTKSGNTCLPPASTLVITPATANGTVGDSFDFCAYKNGTVMEPANWSFTGSGGYQPPVQAIPNNLTNVSCVHLVAAGTQGSPVTVHATNADGSAEAVLSIGAPPACTASLTVTPSNYDQAIRPGDRMQFTAMYGCHQGYDIDVTNNSNWSSAKPNVATVGNVNAGGEQKGRATGVANGTTTITAVYNGVHGPSSATVRLTVTDTIHATCTAGPPGIRSCITVIGAGTNACNAGNPNLGWQDCNSSALCVEDPSTGAQSCAWGYWSPFGNRCQACGGNGPHMACVNKSCVSINTPGANSCATDIDCGGTPPAPSLNFQVNPSSGTDPLSSALTATLSNGAPGTSNYTFWWNCNDPGTSVAAVTQVCGDPHNSSIGAKFDAVPANSQVANTVYHISSIAKVIVENGASALEAHRSVSVTTSGCPVGQIKPYGTCYQNESGVYSCVATDACGVSACANDGDCGGPASACTMNATPKIIAKGGTSNLTWTCNAGVTGCVLYDTTSGSKVSLGSVPSSCPLASSCGAVQNVKPTKTGQYTLECLKSGVSTSASIGVTVTSIIECNPSDPTCKQ